MAEGFPPWEDMRNVPATAVSLSVAVIPLDVPKGEAKMIIHSEDQNHVKAHIGLIKRAEDMYNKHFDEDGNPKTKEGRRLYKKHYVPGYGESYPDSTPFLRKIRQKIRFLIRDLIRYVWRKIDPPVCIECLEPIKGMIMGVSTNYLNSTWYHYDCYRKVYNLPRKIT